MMNMIGQEIAEDEVDDVTRKMQKLTPAEVDQVAEAVGFRVFSSRESARPGEPPFKAITRKFSDNLRKDFETARKITVSILFESDIEQLKAALAELPSHK